MNSEEFLAKLGDELHAYINKLRGLDMLDNDSLIESAKEIARMSDAINGIYENGIDEAEMEYLLRSDTPLADITYVWQQLQDMSTFDTSVRQAIHDIVDKDLFAEEKEDQEISELLAEDSNPIVDRTDDTLIDEMRLGDYFDKVKADYANMQETLRQRLRKINVKTVGEAKTFDAEAINIPVEEMKMAELFEMLMNPQDHFAVEEIA